MTRFHPHRFFVDGGRRVAAWLVRSGELGETRLTPNQLTATGFFLCAAAAIAVTQAPRWIWLYLVVGIVFTIGSLLDVMDGALAKAGGKTTPFGGVLDTFSDRLSEAVMLAGVLYVFYHTGQGFGVAAAVLALIASPLVSHARAAAKMNDINGEKGLGDRMTRCILMVSGLVLQPAWSSWHGGSLVWAVTAIGLIAMETTTRRLLFIRRELQKNRNGTLLRDTYAFMTSVAGIAFITVIGGLMVFGVALLALR